MLARRARGQLATPHAQRSVARVSVALTGDATLPVEDLVDLADKCGTRAAPRTQLGVARSRQRPAPAEHAAHATQEQGVVDGAVQDARTERIAPPAGVRPQQSRPRRGGSGVVEALGRGAQRLVQRQQGMTDVRVHPLRDAGLRQTRRGAVGENRAGTQVVVLNRERQAEFFEAARRGRQRRPGVRRQPEPPPLLDDVAGCQLEDAVAHHVVGDGSRGPLDSGVAAQHPRHEAEA